jgi:hypothetical protein
MLNEDVKQFISGWTYEDEQHDLIKEWDTTLERFYKAYDQKQRRLPKGKER